MVLNQIDFGLSAPESITAVRFGTRHHLGSFGQSPPDLGSLLIHPDADPATVAALEKLGHKIDQSSRPAARASSASARTGDSEAAGDAKAGRHAAAF